MKKRHSFCKEHKRILTKHWQQSRNTMKKKSQQKDGRRPNRRAGQQTTPKGRSRSYTKKQQGITHARFMTQEFKEKNTLIIDGEFLCRHFLYGKCIKGDTCQLKHIEGYNDLIKEPCKFFIQGFCSKGETCIYMHNSIPCKFFHLYKCSQGTDCRFSHEPLNDITKKLLEEIVKNDMRAKQRDEAVSSEQSENTNQPNQEVNQISDDIKKPLWLNFYNSTDSDVIKEINEGIENTTDITSEHEATSSCYIAPTNEPNKDDLVCYSVRAVLGPQLARPFSNCSTTPTSGDTTFSGTKIADSSTYKSPDASLTHPAASPPPSDNSNESHDSPSSADKFLNFVNPENEEKQFQEGAFKSVSSYTNLISVSCPNPVAPTPKSLHLGKETTKESPMSYGRIRHSCFSRQLCQKDHPKSPTTFTLQENLINAKSPQRQSITKPVHAVSHSDSSQRNVRTIPSCYDTNNVKQTSLEWRPNEVTQVPSHELPCVKPAEQQCQILVRNPLMKQVQLNQRAESFSSGQSANTNQPKFPEAIKNPDLVKRSDGLKSTEEMTAKATEEVANTSADEEASVTFCMPPRHDRKKQNAAYHFKEAGLTPQLSKSFRSHFGTLDPASHGTLFPLAKCDGIMVEPVPRSMKTSDSSGFQKHMQSRLNPGTRQQSPSYSLLESKARQCGDLLGYNKPFKRLFNGLFAKPLTETINSSTESIKSTCQSAAESDNASHNPFRTGFALPLGELTAIHPCSGTANQLGSDLSQLPVSNQKASNLETPQSCCGTTSLKESPNASNLVYCTPCPSSNTQVNQPSERLVVPKDSSVPQSTAYQRLTIPFSSNADSSYSVLKTLFLHLSPYHEVEDS